MYKLMIIEDDAGIAGAVKKHMEAWDFEVFVQEDLREVMRSFTEISPHIVLLDISLPFYNGYHWCSEIRKISKVPIIFISSASDSMNVVMAMNMGADDFISKPFDNDVLAAKVMALMRRTYDFAPPSRIIEHRGAVLDEDGGDLTYRGEKIPLTRNEYRILSCLMENKGKTVSREKLMERLWETYEFVDENTLTVNVNRLRKKLASAGLEDFITTKFKSGYVVR